VSETHLEVVRGTAFVAAMLAASLLQRLAPHARLRGSWRVNVGLWLVDAIVVGAVCGACAFTAAHWAERERFGLLNQAGASAWVGLPITIVLLDLVSYGWHRATHRVPLLWRFHQVHHSDSSFTVSTGVRFHPGELLLSLPVRLAAVVLIGASAEAVLLFEVMFAFANLIEHGDINVPRELERSLGRLFITPALHRRHHTKIGPARDTNFGTIFSAWDRLFATYTDNDSATPIETGLPGLAEVALQHALLLPLGRSAA
jgi:sterol desaturase/sphingolipid hydroxylase (fatty acid hydroxylase superfamily)